MTTIVDAANSLLSGTLAQSDSNALAFATYLTPANIAASASAADLPLSTLGAARELMGGVSGLTDHDINFVRLASIAAQAVLGT